MKKLLVAVIVVGMLSTGCVGENTAKGVKVTEVKVVQDGYGSAKTVVTVQQGSETLRLFTNNGNLGSTIVEGDTLDITYQVDNGYIVDYDYPKFK